MESTRLKSSAHQKLRTANPSIRASAPIISTAFITNRNKPNVKMVAGRVKNMSRGFRVTLNIESTNATKSADTKPVRTIASPKIQAVTNTPKVLTTSFMSQFVISFQFMNYG